MTFWLKALCLSLATGVVLSQTSQVLPMTPAQYVTLAKCSFIVFGQFDYETAKEACSSRKAALAFFTSSSEDHVVRKNINWNLMPGFQRGQFWIGQLWIGIKRAPANRVGWAWDNPIVQDMPLPFASWVSGDSTRISGDAGCVLAREDGWVPFNCSGVQNGVKYLGGALCTAASRFEPASEVVQNSNNYCETFLMPPSASNMALPMIIKKNYFLIKGSFTFDQAVQACAQNMSQPATSRSAEEYAFITKNINFNQVDNKAWLGLKRQSAGSSNFTWIDQLPNSYNGGFLDGQPDADGDCAAFERSADGRVGWKMNQCTAAMSVLCETFAIP